MTKSTSWRAAGLTYLNFSNIAAGCVRSTLKKGTRKAVDSNSVLKISAIVNGKQEKAKPLIPGNEE